MIAKLLVMGMMIVVFLHGAASAQDLALELMMPAVTFTPGSPAYLNLRIVNSGSDFPGAQVYVALSIGTGDFWFYPDWVHYPPEIDWNDVNIAAQSTETIAIIPEFAWPSGAGTFSGAMFFAAVMHDGQLISDVADYTFGWTDTSPDFVSVGNMIWVAAGTFVQGSPDDEPCTSADEDQFWHHLSRNLSVMETELSRQMWADLQAKQPSLPSDPSSIANSPTMSHPLQLVTWFQSILFANLLSLQNGYTRCYYTDAGFTAPIDATNYLSGPFFCNFNANGYRLPTEGEWEFLARAGTAGAFSCDESNYTSDSCESCSWGTFPTLEQYSVFCANAPGSSDVIGSKLPNPWGLKDVHGNVWEWCWDWYVAAYPWTEQWDYQGGDYGQFRCRRGGGRYDNPLYCRSADRANRAPDNPRDDMGFRLVRTVE